MADFEYIELRRKVYEGGATFVPVCKTCGRFVKGDKEIWIGGNGEGPLKPGPNATCAKCGRVEMLFEGFY